MTSFPRLASVAVALATCAPLRAFGPATTQIDVVVDVSPEGRKLPHPDAKHPAYYFPVIYNFEEKGAVIAGEKPADRTEVAHTIALELARQGYRVMSRDHQPSLILSIHFGAMNPEITELGDPGDPTQKVFYNEADMLTLVGGNTLDHLNPWFDGKEVMQNAQHNRYFVMVTAWDYEAYARRHKKVPLWQAKMSVPSYGIAQFSNVLGVLVRAGGPLFGTETLRPKFLTVPLTPEGRVEVGTPTVKDYFEAPPPPAAPAK